MSLAFSVLFSGSITDQSHSTKYDPAVKLQLPRKIDQIVLCPLTPLQLSVYENLLQLEDVRTILTADDPCPCGARDSNDLPYARGKCCDPGWAKLIFKVCSCLRWCYEQC